MRGCVLVGVSPTSPHLSSEDATVTVIIRGPAITADTFYEVGREGELDHHEWRFQRKACATLLCPVWEKGPSRPVAEHGARGTRPCGVSTWPGWAVQSCDWQEQGELALPWAGTHQRRKAGCSSDGRALQETPGRRLSSWASDRGSSFRFCLQWRARRWRGILGLPAPRAHCRVVRSALFSSGCPTMCQLD